MIEVQRLRRENKALKVELVELKEKQDCYTEEQACYTVGEIVRGLRIIESPTFSVRYDKDGAKHKTQKYLKYYARRRVGGKLHSVYLGKSLEKSAVEVKIAGYEDKHGVSFTE